MSKIVKVRNVNDYGRYLGCGRCVIMSNLALPKTGCTSAESKQGGLRRSPSVSAMRKQAAPRPKAVQVEGRDKTRFGYAGRSLRSLESKLKPILVLLSVCTVFRDSNSVTNRSARRTQRASFYLHSAEAKPALAAKQQQYAPSFSLSAPCILLTLTHRLRFISNPYFDTPSVIDGRCHREMLA